MKAKNLFPKKVLATLLVVVSIAVIGGFLNNSNKADSAHVEAKASQKASESEPASASTTEPTNLYVKKIASIVSIPANYQVVEEDNQTRNRVKVHITRLQPDGKFRINGPRIVGVFENNILVSLKNLTAVPTGKLLSETKAVPRAEKILATVNPAYGSGSAYRRVDNQERDFLDKNKKRHSFPVQWFKFNSPSGNYAWVTLGASGQIIEVEYESEWDYSHGRRRTEMWDNDDWVRAYQGKGPQLKRPNALASH